MRKGFIAAALLALPLAIGSMVHATTQPKVNEGAKAESSFTCPLTGEELPCPRCCPLNK